MCGIFALLNDSGFSYEIINTQFEKGKNRGPEYSKLRLFLNSHLKLGFHRLAIN
jgi:asparagine synthetase B (glutamine-hydrolysing)